MRAGIRPGWIALALALTLGAMLAWLWRTGSPPASACPNATLLDRSFGLAAAASAHRSEAAAPQNPYAAGSICTRTALPSVPTEGIGYRIRVLDRFDDQPVPGAAVCYLPLDVGAHVMYRLAAAAALAQLGRETTTDSAGYAWIPARRSRPVSVRAGERFALATPDDPLDEGVYAIYVSPDFGVRVHVVEHDGHSAANSEVTLVDCLGNYLDSALTDRDGIVEFLHLQELHCPFGADGQPLLAVREGSAEAGGLTVPIEWADGPGMATVELVRPPLGSLRIVAQTAAGTAVPGKAELHVEAWRQNGDRARFDARTAERAPMVWVFNRVPLGATIQVTGLVNADLVEATLRGPRRAGEEVLLRLHHEADEMSVVGRVEPRLAEPWTIFVGVRVETAPWPVRTGAWVEPDGTFRVPFCYDVGRLGRPAFELTFRGPTIEERVLRLQLPASGARIDVGTVTVRPEAAIPLASVRLTCDGEPVRDGWATWTAVRDGRAGNPLRGTRTADGTIEFTGAQAERGSLKVTAGSPWHVRREVEVAPAGQVDIELERGGLVTAEFLAPGGFPTGAVVTLLGADGIETPVKTFDATLEVRQRLRFGPLRPGSYRLRVGIEGDGAPPAALGPPIEVRPGVHTRLVGSDAIDLSTVFQTCCIEVSPASANARVVRASGTQWVLPVAGRILVPIGAKCPPVVVHADGYVPEVIRDVCRTAAVRLTALRTVRITTTARWVPPPDHDYVQVLVERLLPLPPATLVVLDRAGLTGPAGPFDSSDLDLAADVAWEQQCIPFELLRIRCLVHPPEGAAKQVAESTVQVVPGAPDSVQSLTYRLPVEALDRAVCR